jgi:cytochrome c551/c552
MKQIKTLLLLVPATAALFLYACGNGSSDDEPSAVLARNPADLFRAKCSMCHDFKQDKIGPALSGVAMRWSNDTGKLKQFIRNSRAMIDSGDPYAKELYERWHQSEMPSFPDISDEEMNALIEYLK